MASTFFFACGRLAACEIDGEAPAAGEGEGALGAWNCVGGTGVEIGGVAVCEGVIVVGCAPFESEADAAVGGTVGVEDGWGDALLDAVVVYCCSVGC